MGCTITIDPIQTACLNASNRVIPVPMNCCVTHKVLQTEPAVGAMPHPSTLLMAPSQDSTRDVAPAASDMGPEDMPTCDDEIVNQGESDQDCGDHVCPAKSVQPVSKVVIALRAFA